MARPSENRAPTERFRASAAEQDRLTADALEAGMSKSGYIRHRLFNGQPLAASKGMTRPELMECLELATALQGKLKGLDADADRDMQRLADTLYKALRRDL